MSEHVLKIDFYKPTYNLGVLYDNDCGLDLLFSNIKGSFYMSMEDDYNSIYFEDEECDFSNGQLNAYVDLTEFMDRMASNDYRATDGKARNNWVKLLCGDVGGKNEMILEGYNCFDKNFWEYFFKEMSKDEIKDFIEFCKANIELPNLEVDTVENKWNITNGKVELKIGNGYPITVNDDYTLEQCSAFTCDSKDASITYDSYVNSNEEDYFEESAKNTKKSLKERDTSRLLDVVEDDIRREDDSLVNGVLSLADFETDRKDRFFIPTSSYRELAKLKKRPSTGYANVKGFYIDENGKEIPITFSCILPWGYSFGEDVTKNYGEQLTSYMLQVQEVFVETF